MKGLRTRAAERYVWIGVSAFLLTAVVLVALAPGVLAQNREADRRALLSAFQQILDFVQQNYVDEEKVNTRDLVQGALKGMFEALGDPYSAYLTDEDLRNLEDTTTGEFSGVGIVISKREGARGAEVVSPIEGTPGYRAGLRAGDLIVEVDGEETRELTLNEIVNRIRGPRGTEVRFKVQRGASLLLDITVLRDIVEVPTVKHATMADGVGYLRITTFTPFTAGNIEQALADLDRGGYRALVVDVRDNGGGRLDSVIDIADFFLSSGVIVSTRGRSRAENYSWYASADGTIVPQDLPIVVLINKGSASASEILAGALKDTARATVVGTPSWGKGTVQQVRRIGEFDFKLTMSKYFTPSGVSIDGTGITPDVEVVEEELTEAEAADYGRLVEQNRIGRFVEGNGPPSDGQVQTFVEGLRREGFDIRERILRRLIRDEVNRTNNNPPVYDLEYDLALQKAVEILGQSR